MNMAKVYRKKPIAVEAIELIAENVDEIVDLGGVQVLTGRNGRLKARVETLEGDMKCYEGDYIIKGVDGELYPCKRSIFQKTYELVA